MPVFPLPAPVTVIVDGHPLAAYLPAYVRRGRVYAPVDPLLLRVADRVWIERDAVIVERAGRRVRIPLHAGFPEELSIGYVPVGPLLRALGERVRYLRATRRLEIETPGPVVATPEPFAPGAQTAPRAVFTPEPVSTPRPRWGGPALPRRTPLPAPASSP